jgi:SAM-dependent methyltransferase
MYNVSAYRILIFINIQKWSLLMNNKTIDYYDNNAESFSNGTVNVQFTDIEDRFLNQLHKKALILDFGCGAGRDTKYFLENGYHVDAIDGSKELCRIASDYTGIEVKHLYFQDFHEKNKYDGIWACASLLHLDQSDLENVLLHLSHAIKDDGIIYASFKYGTFEGMRNGRYFNDMNETKFDKTIENAGTLKIVDEWISSDVRPGRGDEKWLNVFLKTI